LAGNGAEVESLVEVLANRHVLATTRLIPASTTYYPG